MSDDPTVFYYPNAGKFVVPTTPSGAEPRSGETPPGAGADLLAGPCAICGLTNYPLSFGGPTICPSCDCGDSGPYVISRQATELRRLAAEVERLRGALVQIRDGAGSNTVASPDVADRRAHTFGGIYRIAADAVGERVLWPQDFQPYRSGYLLHESEIQHLKRERQAIFRALHPECPAHPGVPNTCDEVMCDCFAADNLAQQVTALAAEVEQLRKGRTQQFDYGVALQRIIELIHAATQGKSWNLSEHDAGRAPFHADMMGKILDKIAALRATSQAAAEQIRTRARDICLEVAAGPNSAVELIALLPLPTPDLDAIREAARADGFKQGSKIAIDLAQMEAERRGAERALRWEWETSDTLRRCYPTLAEYVEIAFAALFPAAPEVERA